MSSSPFPQPTTWDWGGSNENKAKMQTPDGNRYTGLSLVTKDASSSVNIFNSLRSPLDPIPGNSGPVSGLRQRRGTQNFDVYDKSSSNAFMSNEKTNCPPRASLTMSMGSKVSNMAPTTPVINGVSYCGLFLFFFKGIILFSCRTEWAALILSLAKRLPRYYFLAHQLNNLHRYCSSCGRILGIGVWVY